MKFCLLAALTLTLAAPLAGQTGHSRLEGCSDPALIAKALQEVSRRAWPDLSVPKLQAIWPVELLGVDCDNNACSSVESKGRVINGRYECSETFLFDGQPSSGAPRAMGLKNLVIHYSARDIRQVVQAARTLSMAAGLSSKNAASIMGNKEGDFTWETPSGVLSGLGVEISYKGTVWTATLNFSRYKK